MGEENRKQKRKTWLMQLINQRLKNVGGGDYVA